MNPLDDEGVRLELFQEAYYALTGQKTFNPLGAFVGLDQEASERSKEEQLDLRKCPVIKADGTVCGNKLTRRLCHPDSEEARQNLPGRDPPT